MIAAARAMPPPDQAEVARVVHSLASMTAPDDWFSLVPCEARRLGISMAVLAEMAADRFLELRPELEGFEAQWAAAMAEFEVVP